VHHPEQRRVHQHREARVGAEIAGVAQARQDRPVHLLEARTELDALIEATSRLDPAGTADCDAVITPARARHRPDPPERCCRGA
jgi:hypothetical protein